MSDTPRTDALVRELYSLPDGRVIGGVHAIHTKPVDLCRQLEQELAELKTGCVIHSYKRVGWFVDSEDADFGDMRIRFVKLATDAPEIADEFDIFIVDHRATSQGMKG